MTCLVVSQLYKSAFYVLLFSITVGMFLATWTGLVMAPALVLMSIVPCVIAVKQRVWKTVSFSTKSLVVAVGASLAWVLISCLWSINLGASLMLFAKLSSLALCGYFLFSYVKELSEKQRNYISKWFAVLYALCVVLLFEEGLSQGALGKPMMQLLGSEFHMYVLNRAACILAVFFWLFAYSLERLVKVVKVRCVVSTAMWLVLAGALQGQLSQSAILAFAGASAAFVLLSAVRKHGKILLQGGLVFGVLVNVWLFAQMDAETIAASNEKLPASAVHRLFIYDFVGEKASEKLFFGWGAGVARYVPEAGDKVKSVRALSGWTNIPLHTHNNVSQIWLELGLVGVLLFCWLIYLIVDKIYAQTDAKNCEKITLASMVCAYMLVGLVGFGVWQPWWISTGIIAAAFALAMRSSSAR